MGIRRPYSGRVSDELASVVPTLLGATAYVSSVELRGSRARGTANRFSDWDFVVLTPAFEELAPRLPDLVRPLEPLVQQWDRLSDHACYMLIVSGPTKIDLIFEDVPHQHAPRWVVTAQTLPAINDHFWDWTLWLTSKVAAGKAAIVSEELAKMSEHLLAPLGVPQPPTSLREAMNSYLGAIDSWAQSLDVTVDRRAEQQITPVIEGLPYE